MLRLALVQALALELPVQRWLKLWAAAERWIVAVRAGWLESTAWMAPLVATTGQR